MAAADAARALILGPAVLGHGEHDPAADAAALIAANAFFSVDGEHDDSLHRMTSPRDGSPGGIVNFKWFLQHLGQERFQALAPGIAEELCGGVLFYYISLVHK